MTEVETGGGVVFACTGVEPREGQTLVVVGSSSELGGWDVSRGVTLHRVKNPAFPGVWMSFPMFHSASSQVKFQFVVVGPTADSSSVGGSLGDGGSLINAGVSEVASALSAAAPTYGRSENSYGCAWEPLGCGLREVEVVDGGFVLFGGRWGEGETQVTPLTREDMVQAQQELTQNTLEVSSISSENDIQTEKEGREKMREGNLADITAEADKVPLSLSTVPSAHSPPCPTFASSQRGRGKRTEMRRGTAQPVQTRAEFPACKSRASGQEGGPGGSGEVRDQSAAFAAVARDTLMASVESVQEGDGVPSRWGGGRFEIPPVSERLQGGGYGVMQGRRGHRDSDQALRFAPAALKRGYGMGGEEGEMLGGKIAENASGLTGGYDSVFVPSLLVGKRQQIPREPPAEERSMSAVVEGPKRRRLLCVSPAVYASHSDMRGGPGAEASVRERSLSTGVFATVPKEQSRSQESRASFDSVALSLGVHCTKAFQGDRVCRSVEKGKMERKSTERGGASGNGKGDKGVIDTRFKYPHVELQKCERAQQHHVCAAGARGNIGLRGGEKKRECTGEVKRDRQGNILCPHGRRCCQCKECGGKSTCEHGRLRSHCKECGGKSICEHGRRRTQCRECGGKAFCEHGRRRTRCRDCGGANICEHGRQRNLCKECGGKSICEHGRQRSICKECGGKSICEHGRKRCICKECGGASICEHGRQRFECKECGGKGICEHGRRRCQCKECGGKSICEHGRRRDQCKECGGGGICVHGRQKYRSKDCGWKEGHEAVFIERKNDGGCRSAI